MEAQIRVCVPWHTTLVCNGSMTWDTDGMSAGHTVDRLHYRVTFKKMNLGWNYSVGAFPAC